MNIEKVIIVGSGLRGGGIAQVCAQAGLRATLNDVSPEALARAVKNISWSVGKFVEKGKVMETVDEVMTRITTSTEMAASGDSDLIIEAVYENVELKREVFRQIDKVAKSGAVIAGN